MAKSGMSTEFNHIRTEQLASLYNASAKNTSKMVIGKLFSYIEKNHEIYAYQPELLNDLKNMQQQITTLDSTEFGLLGKIIKIIDSGGKTCD